MNNNTIPFNPENTLATAFQERVALSPDATAYIQFDASTECWQEHSWQDTKLEVVRWQQALQKEGLVARDRVAIMLKNCWEWVIFDQAALGLGLVTVPIYTNDRAENIAYILKDAGVKLLFIDGQEQWQVLRQVKNRLHNLQRIVSLHMIQGVITDSSPRWAEEWLPKVGLSQPLVNADIKAEQLATIVYTSGTTGRPKGVMLSHRNILWNADAGIKSISVYNSDRFLSFLPLSHTLERTIGYYIPMLSGATVAFTRSIPQLAEDFLQIKPTIVISVPRIFERIYAKINDKLIHGPQFARRLFNLAITCGWRRFLYRQGRSSWSPLLLLWPLLNLLVASKVRAKLGGNLRFAISGGAALPFDISKMFIALGIPIQQGYGLTETSPVISVNSLEENDPSSVGTPLTGVEIMLGKQYELLTRSPAVMLGYWNSNTASSELIDKDGWLHTGDQVKIEDNHIYITGRLKEIIVLANGEKISPNDMELAISLDNLIEQVIVLGEGRPFLSALLVLNQEILIEVTAKLGLSTVAEQRDQALLLQQELLQRISNQLRIFPGYAQIHQVAVVSEPWGIENSMMTPTLKLRRSKIINHYSELIEELYRGHNVNPLNRAS